MLPELEYVRPASLSEALTALRDFPGRSYALAGGTDLLISLRNRRLEAPLRLVDVSRLPELCQIREENGTVVLGGCVTHSRLVNSPVVQQYLPVLAEAAAAIGSEQIRNRGTLGGNLCNASPCADTAPALLVLNAEVEIASTEGGRRLSLADFLQAPYRTALQPGELLVSVHCEKLPEDAGCAFLKLGRRSAMSIARINVAAVLGFGDYGEIADARLAAGSIMPRTARLHSAEKTMMGETPSDELFRAVGDFVAKEMIATAGRRWSTPYKKKVVPVLVQRVLSKALISREREERD